MGGGLIHDQRRVKLSSWEAGCKKTAKQNVQLKKKSRLKMTSYPMMVNKFCANDLNNKKWVKYFFLNLITVNDMMEWTELHFFSPFFSHKGSHFKPFYFAIKMTESTILLKTFIICILVEFWLSNAKTLHKVAFEKHNNIMSQLPDFVLTIFVTSWLEVSILIQRWRVCKWNQIISDSHWFYIFRSKGRGGVIITRTMKSTSHEKEIDTTNVLIPYFFK